MKVTIEVDCTPIEARQFFGLPDVEPMQKAMLTEMERRMMAEMEKFSPDGLMQTWFSSGAQGVEMFRNLMSGFLAKSVPGESGSTAAPGRPK